MEKLEEKSQWVIEAVNPLTRPITGVVLVLSSIH
ncbi:MAG: hypothetical protein A07HR60_01798 [uncultured archaeon A07HR60]|nr:MAG: hypothetical protein A07HR60_01798 [uncultured archaeon A07HR60]